MVQPLSRAAKKAFSHNSNKEVCNAQHHWFKERGGKLFLPPTTDYLVLGMCCQPELYDKIIEWLPGHKFQMTKRMYIANGKIYCDDRKVGHIGGSKAGVTRHGKKLAAHFTGTFFRKPSTRDHEEGGCGLTEAHAMDFLEQFAKFLVKQEVANSGWLGFRTIDRWDICQEIEFDRRVTPSDIQKDLKAPYGLELSEINKSNTGETLYGSSTNLPSGSRGDYPQLAIYQHAHLNGKKDEVSGKLKPCRIRVEIRLPKIRNVDPHKSFGQHSAAQYAADVLNALGPRPVELERAKVDPLTRVHPQGDVELLRPLTFGPVAPEEFTRRPYSGHPSKTLRRMMRQGVTVIGRAVAAFTTASLLSGCEFDREYLDDYEKSETYHELCRQAEAGIGYRRQPTDDGELSYDLIGAPLPGSEARPFDSGYPVEDLMNKIPLNLDEIEEVQLALELYRQRCIPDSQPFWETRRSEIAFMRLPADVRLMNPEHEDEVLKNVYDTDHWMQRFLDPTSHEPLNSDDRWLACASEKELAYWSPKSRKENKKSADITISRT